MIGGIGVDIVETARIERVYERFGARFARRILTADELAEFARREHSCRFLATRFAAKEAAAKALGTGIGESIGFQSMQIDNDARGKPCLRFLDRGRDLAAGLGIGNALVSLADEKHYVVAMVVLES